jgi:hypothetical protein
MKSGSGKAGDNGDVGDEVEYGCPRWAEAAEKSGEAKGMRAGEWRGG